jgi:hypothetical protein
MKDTLIFIAALYCLIKVIRRNPVELPPYIETEGGYIVGDIEKWASDLLGKHEKEI